jgi:glycerol-3-phosphate cytidylyltransferase
MNDIQPQEETILKKGLVCSAFDLLHAGHMLMLKDAKAHCDFLILGLQIDPSVTGKLYRGKKKPSPVMSIEERMIILEGIKYIDEIFVYADESDLLEAIKALGPHIRILGSDWEGKQATGQDYADEIYYHKRNHDFSTSNLREKIKNS